MGANMGVRWAEVRGWYYDLPLDLLALGKVVDVLFPPRHKKMGVCMGVTWWYRVFVMGLPCSGSSSLRGVDGL